jgi:hypothetical protein
MAPVMTTYTITTAKNMTELTGKAGSDTYNVNGGTLTIDSDTRYGPNTAEATGPFGNISASATLGGDVKILGTNVWAVKISGGSGTSPAAGTTITQGGVTAELLLHMSNKHGEQPFASGVVWNTYPNTYVKFRNMTGGTFALGTATLSNGSTITISEVPSVSFIEVVGVEALTLTINRLNKLTVTGDWYYALDASTGLGLTTGVVGQQFQLPFYKDLAGAYLRITEYPGVEVETGPGTGIYEHWPNTGTQFFAANHSTDSRCKFVYINPNGKLTFGLDPNSVAAGYNPVAGCKVRIPNIVTSSTNGTVGFAKNAIPSGTMGTRYELATNSSGTVDIRQVTGSWYWNIQQAYSVYLRNLHTCEQFVLGEPSTPVDIDGLMVGLSNQATPYASNSIVFQQCLNGGTANNVTGIRAQQASTSGYSVYFVNLFGGWTLTNIRGGFASDATAMCGPVFFNTCDNITVSNVWLIGKRLLISACTNYTVDTVYYADNPKSTTLTTFGSHAVEVMSNAKQGVVQNINNWPGLTNVHPYNGLLYCNTVSDLLFTGAGSSSTPFDGGSTNKPGYIFSDGGLNKNIKLQRNWINGLRTGLASSTNTSQAIRMQNCYNTDASLTQGPNWYNSTVRGNRQNSGSVPTSYTHVDGMHFWDAFTGDTTTRLALVFTEKSLTTASAYTIDAGTPKFASTGALVMATAGDQITWTQSYYTLGWSALTTFAATGTNTGTNFTITYDLDKGAGFSGTFKTLSNANLAAETGISPTTGFKAKFRILCTVSNTTNLWQSLVINGATTLALQNAALYPLDTIGLTLSGIKPGSDVVVYQAGTTNVLDTGDSVGASSYTYAYTTLQNVDIGVLLSGYRPYYIRNYPLTSTPTSLPVAQEVDRSYI